MHSNATRPNIVLVSIDSLRADHCGFLGDERGLTPTMDALAGEGVTFENAISPGPQTFSSMPAVFTGHHRPSVDPDVETTTSHWERQLRLVDRHLDRHGSVAEALRDLGYATAGFSPNPWTSRSAGWDRGFDHFSDLSGEEGGRFRRFLERIPGIDTDRKPVELAVGLMTGSSFFARWEGYYDDVVDLVERLPEPYFLWVFVLDTHFPFAASRRYRAEASLLETYVANVRAGRAMRDDDGELPDAVRTSVRRSYRDAVRATDAFLARLQDDLAEDDPVLFVHSDHGESFGEHGNYGHSHAELFEENVHVPYFVHGTDATGEIEAPTSLASIYDAVVSTARRGSFEPAETVSDVVFAKNVYGSTRTARDRRFKLVERRDGELLIDLETDPDERVDRSNERQGRKADLAEAVEKFERRVAEADRLAGASRAVAAGGEF